MPTSLPAAAPAGPRVSVVIRTKNEERYIAQTLEAVLRQEVEFGFEVLVIDSGSTDRTLELVRRFDVRLHEIEPDSFTFGRALNLGARLAAGDWVINLSGHCIPLELDWMARLVEPLQGDERVAATHGRQVPLKGVNPYEERLLLAAFAPDRDGAVSVLFSNSNAAVRKSALQAHPFDEETAFAEDLIWARTLPPPWRIAYVHSAAVYHSHPLSLGYWSRRYFQIGLQERYVRHVYGLEPPQHEGAGQDGVFHEAGAALSFLLRSGYYRHLLLFPLHFLIRRSSYHRGLREGLRRYGSGAR